MVGKGKIFIRGMGLRALWQALASKSSTEKTLSKLRVTCNKSTC